MTISFKHCRPSNGKPHDPDGCPYFTTDGGGPGPVMLCGHPSLPFGYEHQAIVSHPDCDTGFPKKCPLLTSPLPARIEKIVE